MKISRKLILDKFINRLLIFVSLFLCVIIGVLFVIGIDYSINKQAIVLPKEFNIVRAQKDGLIVTIKVQNGQLVNQNDTLFILDHYEIQNKIAEYNYETKLKLAYKIKLENEIALEEQSLAFAIEHAQNDFKISQLQHSRILDDYSITRKYYSQLQQSTTNEELAQYELEKSKLIKLNSEIEAKIAHVELQENRNRIHEVHVLEKEIEIIKNKMELLNHLIHISSVLAPDSGIIYELFQEELQYRYVRAGEGLCHIYHANGAWIAKLFLENREIPEINLNLNATIDFLGYDRSEYGYFEGVVNSISPNLTVDEEKDSRYLICDVMLKKYIPSAASKDPNFIKPGMMANVTILLEDKSIFEIIYEKVF
jgi:multidrug resistance efflux pump